MVMFFSDCGIKITKKSSKLPESAPYILDHVEEKIPGLKLESIPRIERLMLSRTIRILLFCFQRLGEIRLVHIRRTSDGLSSKAQATSSRLGRSAGGRTKDRIPKVSLKVLERRSS